MRTWDEILQFVGGNLKLKSVNSILSNSNSIKTKYQPSLIREELLTSLTKTSNLLNPHKFNRIKQQFIWG